MRADVRQGDSPHSVDWCDDPPQEVRALPQDVLCDAQAADILRGNLVVRFLKSRTHPFAELALFRNSSLKPSQLPDFPRVVRAAHHVSIEIPVRIPCGRLLLPLTLCSFLIFLFCGIRQYLFFWPSSFDSKVLCRRKLFLN